jgi:flagellar biogenesis protein FliO
MARLQHIFRALFVAFAAMSWAACCAELAAQEAAISAVGGTGPSQVQFVEPATVNGFAPATPLLEYRKPGAPAAAGDDNPLRPVSATQPLPAEAGDDRLTARRDFPNPALPTETGTPSYAAPAVASAPLPAAEAAMQADAAAAFDGGAAPAESAGGPVSPSPPITPPPVDDYAAAPLAAYESLPERESPTSAVAAAPLPTPNFPQSSNSTSSSMGDPTMRRLAPPSSASASGASRGGRGSDKYSLMPTAFSQLKSLTSAGAGLAVVVGLFVACALLLRRSGPKPTGVLPAEAFAVLGRAPLSPQSFAQLLRLGNKLVLVSVTADGAQPLAEVTDPLEVDRIAGLCVSGRGGGPSAEFQQVLAQLSREPAKGFLGREGSSARRRS